MKKINGIRVYTLDEVFKKKNKEFQRGYREEDMRIRLAKKIRETRIAKNLTQKAVAQRASMPQSVIARLESGEHTVSLETLGRIAHALGKAVALV